MLHYDSLYKVNNGDDLGSATYWNGRFQDIDLRLNVMEGWTGTINDAVGEVIDSGLTRINETFTPYVDGLIAQVNTLSAEVAQLENTVVTDQNSVNNQLNNLLAQAQTLVNNLQTLGAIQGGTF